MTIEYAEKGRQDLDSIAPLWNKLREHQRIRSPHFAEHYARRTWKRRKAELLQKAESGGLHLDIVMDSKTKKIIGYCVSIVSSDKQGKLESIYVEPKYRQFGIGDQLMQRTLKWMDEKQAKTKTLTVGVGNEEVLTFYSRYGFYPKHITVEQVETRED
ncbi:MAG TPA: GNAT family N-acetyltransferase [Dehalococcoidales bacterium]